MRTEDGRFLRGTREIFAHLRQRDPWRFAAAHRRRFADHREARESDATGKLLEYFRDAGELEPRTASPGEATVVNVPEAHRFELLLDGQRIGELAYRQRKGRIAFTHTNVNPAYEGRGFGGRLAEAALADARRQGLTVVPLCPFIAWYIEQHPEHGNLVAADYAGRRDES
jgi:predicted GNAT family acetyltransferase